MKKVIIGCKSVFTYMKYKILYGSRIQMASADVARTYLWMLINMPDYAENYLERFCNETNTSSKYVHNWIPIVAAARCAKNIPEEVKILNGLISVMEY